jgi:hypothetical protein
MKMCQDTPFTRIASLPRVRRDTHFFACLISEAFLLSSLLFILREEQLKRLKVELPDLWKAFQVWASDLLQFHDKNALMQARLTIPVADNIPLFVSPAYCSPVDARYLGMQLLPSGKTLLTELLVIARGSLSFPRNGPVCPE